MRWMGLLLVAALLASCEASGAVGDAPRVSATLSLQRLWVRTIQPNADSAAAYLPHVRVRGKTRAVVYVLAGNNTANCSRGDPVRRATTEALDAASGTVLWSASTSGPSRCTTAGPVVDPSGRWVYASGLDGRIHRYNAATGGESHAAGWPKSVTLNPDAEKMSATPTIGNGYLYVTTSGYIGDQDHYEGHLVTINLKTGRSHVFNTLCSNIRQLLSPTAGRPNYCPLVRSGLFGRGEGVVDPVSHAVYIVSGNGPWDGRTSWGDSVLKLNASGSRLLDAFTPTDQDLLDSTDADLGSTGPAILPTVRHAGRTYHLLVQGGKGPACSSCRGTVLRLLNRDNLSGHGGPGHLGGDLQDIATPGGCEVLTAPAVWTSPAHAIWVLIADDCAVAGYRLAWSNGGFRLSQGWSDSTGGTTPVVSGGILWVAGRGEIRGYRLSDHTLVASVHGIGDVHWEYPLVAGGRLFMTDESGHVVAYAIRSSSAVER